MPLNQTLNFCNYALMTPGKIEYRFTAQVWQHTGVGGWHFASLPVKLSKEIRETFKTFEGGWGRLTCSALIGKTEWKTAIWFDSKKNCYLLPLKAEVRRKEKLQAEKKLRVTVFI